MKRLILAACALTCAASVFGQGQVQFNNRVTTAGLVSHIYGPNTINPLLVQQGNGTADQASGTTDWSAAAGWGNPLDGSTGTYTVQLWAASGTGMPESSLVAVPTTTTMRTGAAAGFVTSITPVVPNVAGGTGGPGATFVVRAWDNAGGTVTDWASATTRGESVVFSIAGPLGGGTVLPPPLVGWTSFNIAPVPEPSTFALAGLGAAALLIFRRRK